MVFWWVIFFANHNSSVLSKLIHARYSYLIIILRIIWDVNHLKSLIAEDTATMWSSCSHLLAASYIKPNITTKHSQRLKVLDFSKGRNLNGLEIKPNGMKEPTHNSLLPKWELKPGLQRWKANASCTSHSCHPNITFICKNAPECFHNKIKQKKSTATQN